MLSARLYIKSKNKLGEIVSILKNHGIDTKSLFTQLKEKGYFEFNTDDNILKKILEELENDVEVEIANSKMDIVSSNYKEEFIHSSFGLMVLLIFDVLIILSVIEFFSKSIRLDDIINSVVLINKVGSIVELLIKISFSFIFIKGITQISNTTLLGKYLSIKIEGINNFTLMMFLFVVSYYLLNSTFSLLRYFGLFLVIFIFIAVFFAYENLGIGLKREKD